MFEDHDQTRVKLPKDIVGCNISNVMSPLSYILIQWFTLRPSLDSYSILGCIEKIKLK